MERALYTMKKPTKKQGTENSREKSNRPVVFLMGPTACGKTDLAAALFDEYPAELVSVDAAQVYRGMDIGTAKPARAFLGKYPHHLIDVRDPHQTYCAAEFRDDALALIERIHAAGKLPILVGGTMFYFAALEHGLSGLPSADPETRRQIAAETARRGLPAMHARLQRLDPALAATISPADPQRIQRALEIHRLSGRPPGEVMAQSKPRPIPHPVIKLGLFIADRAALHRRIAARFACMLEQGLVDEVKTLAAAIPDPDLHPGQLPSLRTVGYRQALGFLRGEFTHDQMTERSVAATRQLAKRQLTWMRRQRNLVWLDAADPKATDNARAYLQNRV